MQSEDFDKKIRDAAERHHPTYDEKAWSKMEMLLDKHMPVEKDRKRRFLLILFFFMLLGGGAFIWFGTGILTSKSREFAVAPVNDPAMEKPGNGSTKVGEKSELIKNNIPAENVTKKQDKNVRKNNDPEQILKNALLNEPGSSKRRKAMVPADKISLQSKDPKKGKKKDEYQREKKGRSLVIKAKPSPGTIPVSEIKDSKLSPVKKDDPIISSVIKPEPILPAAGIPVTGKKDNSKENDALINLTHTAFPAIDSVYKAEYNKPVLTRLGRKKGSFFLAASIAPDLSVVGLSEFGKVRTAYGLGIGYKRGRVMLRSGLYIARKVYDAYPEDYKAPAAFYTRYPNLQEIKADCKVYEIPLLVSYDLAKAGKGHWFLTTGISSYLMKRETYDYYYKWNANGPVVHRERTITNANQHYFSVASFSAGYKLSLSKKITILAEPYVKLPLTGIGFGKVKLNSAGVLFSMAFRPF